MRIYGDENRNIYAKMKKKKCIRDDDFVDEYQSIAKKGKRKMMMIIISSHNLLILSFKNTFPCRKLNSIGRILVEKEEQNQDTVSVANECEIERRDLVSFSRK